MAKTALETPKSPQEEGLESLVADMAKIVKRHDQALNELAENDRKDIAEQARKIAELSDKVERTQSDILERFRGFVDRYANSTGGPHVGFFPDHESARAFGRACIALVRKNTAKIEQWKQEDPLFARMCDASTASISGDTGEDGDFIRVESVVPGILRTVENFGVFERNVRVVPLGSQDGGLIRRTSGLAVRFPQLGQAPAESKPKFGKTNFSLTVWAVLAIAENSMFQDNLVIALAEFIVSELQLALAEGTDQFGFAGDGSDAHGRVTGFFNYTPSNIVIADVGDNTFAKVAAKNMHYLAKCFGALPEKHHQTGVPSWVMSRSIFALYLGVLDTTNQPIVHMISTAEGPVFRIMGYPIVLTSFAPTIADSGVSKTMLGLSSLRNAFAIANHAAGAELRSSDQVKWLELETALMLHIRRDIKPLEKDATVWLQTAGS